MSEFHSRRSWRGRARGRAGVAMLAVLGLAGCDSLLEVKSPGTLPAEQLRNPDNAIMLANSVQAQFECYLASYSGAHGVWVGEAIAGSQRAGRHFWATRQVLPYETRAVSTTESCEPGGNAWTYIGTGYNAYGLGRDVSTWLSEWTDDEVPNRQRLLSQSQAYTAYALMLFSESFCAGAVLEPDAELSTPRQVNAAAEEWWTQALQSAEASGNTAIKNLALVGRARTRLWRGDAASRTAAAADAAQVPAGFRFDATYASHPQRENRIFTEFERDLHYSVAPAFRGLTVDGVEDTRIQPVSLGRNGIDGRTPIWVPAKYRSDSAPIRMASWNEAQLILAEVAAFEGRVGDAVNHINAVRSARGLPLYTHAGGDIVDAVLTERRYELFLEGQALNDMLRHFDRPTVRGWWPEGETHDANPIFPNYCIWFPQRELEANPNVDESDIPRSMTPDVMRR